VGLDEGTIPDPVAIEERLHAADVVRHDVEVDGDDGGVEIGQGGHDATSPGRAGVGRAG